MGWSEFGECSKICGGGFKTRSRVCLSPPGKTDMGCLGPRQEVKQCNIQCCPIMGQHTAWSTWSECSKPCGGGMQYRSRVCEGAKCGGRCYGQKTEARSCNNFCCPVNTEFEEGATNYTKCSQDCDGGIKFSVRPTTTPKCGGKIVAEYERIKTLSCNSAPCHVDGGWSAWTPWERCSEPKQQITRQRFCNAPHKQGHGKGCEQTRYECTGPTVTDRNCKMTTKEVDVMTETRLCNHDWEKFVSEEKAEELDTELEAVADA